MLPQDVAQVNEENLPTYNRCALYALGAAYLNLISQLTTVPAFCQHIHEVGVIRGPRAWWALCFGESVEELKIDPIIWCTCCLENIKLYFFTYLSRENLIYNLNEWSSTSIMLCKISMHFFFQMFRHVTLMFLIFNFPLCGIYTGFICDTFHFLFIR